MESVKYAGCAENYGDVRQIKAYRESISRLKVAVVDSKSRIGLISIQFQGEALEIKHEGWVDTGLDFVGCLHLSGAIYATEYGSLHQISIQTAEKSSNGSPNDSEQDKLTERLTLADYDSKIVKIIEIGEEEIFYFVEDGKFCRLEQTTKNKEDQRSSESSKFDSRVVSSQRMIRDPSRAYQETQPLDTGFDHVYSVSASVNSALIVVSGKLKSFSPKVMTKVMVHPSFILNSSCPVSSFQFFATCIRRLRLRKGNYNDLIFAIKSQNMFMFVVKYLEKLLFKETNRASDSQREEILL